jgi:hypothetical protein
MITMLSEKKAREIAGQWYTGQWSGLYKVASCSDYSLLSRHDWTMARCEAQRESQLCRDNSQHREAKNLSGLAEWIRFVAAKHGKPTEGVLV